MIARPIPPGVTVIAKPCPGYPAIPLPPQQTLVTPASTTTSSSNNVKFNPDAKPFIPAANCVQTPETPPGSTQSQPANKSKNKPMVMVWNATCPEGRLVPVRQPAPPVYFHPATKSNHWHWQKAIEGRAKINCHSTNPGHFLHQPRNKKKERRILVKSHSSSWSKRLWINVL